MSEIGSHWKLVCAASLLAPAAVAGAVYANRGDAPVCTVAVQADNGLQPGFAMLSERISPVCTRVELPPIIR